MALARAPKHGAALGAAWLVRSFPKSIDSLPHFCLAVEIAATAEQSGRSPTRYAKKEPAEAGFVLACPRQVSGVVAAA
jgi:hypothetical protein